MDFMSESKAARRAAEAALFQRYPSADERLLIRQLTASARAYADLLELASSRDFMASVGREIEAIPEREDGDGYGEIVAVLAIREFLLAAEGGVPGVLLVLPEEVS